MPRDSSKGNRVFSVIEKTPHHIYQILTKRSEHMQSYFSEYPAPSNVWLGVSVENRHYGMPRIDDLKIVDCTVRFISAEPLLEDLGEIELAGIHWMIVGGKSGPNARSMKTAWVENIYRQCQYSNTAFFFKLITL